MPDIYPLGAALGGGVRRRPRQPAILRLHHAVRVGGLGFWLPGTGAAGSIPNGLRSVIFRFPSRARPRAERLQGAGTGQAGRRWQAAGAAITQRS